MAFVAGHKHDLFVSYALGEAEWVEAFLKKLGEEFHARTGEALSIWQDSKRLRLGQKWDWEIEEAIRVAAAFLAVVSPSYLNSFYCREEREIFLAEGLESRKAGSFYRIVKIIKTFDSYRPRTTVLPNLQEMFFCDESDGYELPEGSLEFAVRIRACVRQIRELFRILNNERQAVYLAPGHIEMKDRREELKHELKDQGFTIKPEVLLDHTTPRDAIREAMEHASLVVFLFASVYDKFTAAQVEVAQELDKPILFWVQAGKQQEDLLRRLDEMRDLPARSEIVKGRSLQELIPQLLDKLRLAKVRQKVTAESGNALVYVNYDFTDPVDSSTVMRIADVVRANRFEVAQSSRETDHDELMRTSNAVLVFRAANPKPDEWLKHNAMELVVPAYALERQAEFDAKALLVSEPGRIQFRVPGVPVYAYSESFDPATLGPFFDSIKRPGLSQCAPLRP
jgi:hypothetical protein